MGENSKIEWTDHTFNPWVGCQKVGPPCDNCYAEGWAKRSGMVKWGPGEDRRRTSAANWRKPLQWAKLARLTGKRPRVFCASLADWLDNQVPWQWREDLADLIRQTPELDWLLLTKRIQNYQRLAPWPYAPGNVWLGITCGDQKEYDRDWPILAGIPATVRFISYEPGEFTVYTSHWRPLYDEGLTPPQAWQRALDGFAAQRKADDEAKTANYARIVAEDKAAIARERAAKLAR